MKPTAPVFRPRVRRLVQLVAAAVALGSAGLRAAAAQTTPEPPPPTVAAQPAPPPPTGAFPPPPPRFEDQAAAEGQSLVPREELPWSQDIAAHSTDPAASVRRFSFTAALGPGMLAGPGERSLAMSYQLFRLGLGLNERLAIVLGFAGVGTSSVNPLTMRDSWLKQDLWSAGLQVNLMPRLYVRGGMGIGLVSESVGDRTFSGGRGLAVEAAVGWELLQMRHLAMAVELNGSNTHYPRESWQTAGLQVAVSLF